MPDHGSKKKLDERDLTKMDTTADAGCRFHGPHLPTTVRRQLPETLREIESAIGDFLQAADDLVQTYSRCDAERVWLSSRMAWSLMFPYRRPVLRANPALVEAFRAAVSRVRDALGTERSGEDEFTEYLRHDLSRRERLLEALLSENSETRIRELLAAERHAAESN
jgi:hypothetical protein